MRVLYRFGRKIGILKESLLIPFHPETASLNKKNEIYQGCKHKHFKFLADCKVTWSSRSNPKSLSLFCYYQCSMTNHFYISVMADESMTKQYCPIIQYTVMWLLLYSLWQTGSMFLFSSQIKSSGFVLKVLTWAWYYLQEKKCNMYDRGKI